MRLKSRRTPTSSIRRRWRGCTSASDIAAITRITSIPSPRERHSGKFEQSSRARLGTWSRPTSHVGRRTSDVTGSAVRRAQTLFPGPELTEELGGQEPAELAAPLRREDLEIDAGDRALLELDGRRRLDHPGRQL